MGIRNTKEIYNAYMRKYHKQQYYEIRNKAIKILGGKCVICSTTKNLRFDHKNPNKKILEVSKFIARSPKKFWKELKKCQLLCHKHHNEKTLKERGLQNAQKIHGTLSSYFHCKCELCKEAKRKYTRKYRLNHSRKKEYKKRKLKCACGTNGCPPNF